MAFRADQADLSRLSSTLNESLSGLNEAAGAPAADVDAGASTASVAGLMATFYDTLATMATDTQQAAAEVADSGGVYTRTDDQAASELPPLPLPTNGGN